MQTKYEQLNDNKGIEEILTTEQTYNECLTRLEKAFSQPSLIGDNKLLQEIAPIITYFKGISDKLLENTTTAINVAMDDTMRVELRAQRKQFLKAFATVLTTYMPLFDQYTQQSVANKQFEAMDSFIRTNNPNRLGLADHLITPVQRGPRYKMLLEATKKLTTHLEDKHLEELTALEETISEGLKEANASMPTPTKSNSRWGLGNYKFGDLTRYALGKSSNDLNEQNSSQNPGSPGPKSK